MASKKKFTCKMPDGTFVYHLKEKKSYWFPIYTAAITDFDPNTEDVFFPSTVDGFTVSEISLGDKIWKEVTSLTFPDIRLLGLRNYSFPALEEVHFLTNCFYTDGRMIYSRDRSKLFFSLAGREDEVIHVPDYVKYVDETAFCDSRCKDIVFDNPKVKIDTSTFRRSTYIKNHPAVILGDKLIYLGDDIPVLELPDQVKKIEKGIFIAYSPQTLRASYLPDFTDEENSIKAFELTSQTAPLSVEILAHGYPSLSSIKVPEDHFRYETKEGVLYDKRTKKLLFYPPCREGNTYEIEEGTLAIGPYAFYRAQYLKEVKIPDSVKDIGAYAFIICPSLQKVNLPPGIEGIPQTPSYVDFYGTINTCKHLKEITLSHGLKYLGYSSLLTKSVCLKEITIPDTMEYLGSYCFSPLKDAAVHLPASLLITSSGSLAGCQKVWAYEGTARGLVLAINLSIDAEGHNGTWREATVIVLDENGQEKALFYIPEIQSAKGRKALVMAWDSEEIDYDAYDIAFRHVEDDNIKAKLLMALLLVLDGGLKGAALDYLHQNKHLVMAGSLLISYEYDRYFDRYLALEDFTLSDIDELLAKCGEEKLLFYRERLLEKKKEMEGGR